MKIGLMENMLRGDTSAKFAEAKRAGYAGIELIVSSPQNPLWEEPGLAEVKDLQSRYSLEVPSLCLQGYMQLDFRHREEETRRKGIAFVRHAVEVIAALGGHVPLLPFFSQEYPLKAEDVTDQRLIEGFKACTL